MIPIAVIGGTGLDRLPGLETVSRHTRLTAYGPPSAPLVEGRLAGIVSLGKISRVKSEKAAGRVVKVISASRSRRSRR